MKTAIIACGTIEAEVKKVLELTGNKDMPSVFLKPGLDNNPENLKSVISEEIEKFNTIETILLGYGYSNEALGDFSAKNHSLIAPNVEDVICIVLGSQKRRDKLLEEASSYFITEGWLKGDNLFSEYEKAVKKYGPEKANKVHKMMMSHYKRYLLIETGTYDIEGYLQKFQEFSKYSGLAVETTKGDLTLLKDLVSQNYIDKRFVKSAPGESIKIDPLFGV